MKKKLLLMILFFCSLIRPALAEPTVVCLSEHNNYKIEFFLSNPENPTEGTTEAKEYNFGYNPYGSWEAGQMITCQPPLKDNKKLLALCGIRHGPDAATKIYLYQKDSSGKYKAGTEAFGPDGKSGGERKLTCE